MNRSASLVDEINMIKKIHYSMAKRKFHKPKVKTMARKYKSILCLYQKKLELLNKLKYISIYFIDI